MCRAMMGRQDVLQRASLASALLLCLLPSGCVSELVSNSGVSPSVAADACPMPPSFAASLADAGTSKPSAKFFGIEATYQHGFVTTVVQNGRISGSTTARLGSKVKIGPNGDVYSFIDEDSGEIFILNQQVDFVLAQDRRGPRPARQFPTLSYYKGLASFQNGSLTRTIVYGGKRGSQCGHVMFTDVISFSEDFRRCTVDRVTMRIEVPQKNSVTEGTLQAPASCIVI